MTERRCTAAGCVSKLAPGKFMCRLHWFGLPKPLRDEVWRTWRIVQGQRRSDAAPEVKIGQIRDYRDACAAAESYWNEP